MKGRAIIVKRRRSPPPRIAHNLVKLHTPKTPAAPIIAARVSLGDRQLQLARALADTERSVRDAAVIALETWLRENAQSTSENLAPQGTEQRTKPDKLTDEEQEKGTVAPSGLSDADWDRLCKALFYCVWMADKRPIISGVIDRLVGFENISGWPYLNALFRCIVREWHGIDRHRLNKFYELTSVTLDRSVARVVHEATTIENNRSAVARLLKLLQTEVLDKAATNASSGVALHVFDYWHERILRPLLAHTSATFPGNEVHRIFDDIMDPPCRVLGAKRFQQLALSRRAIDRAVSTLPDLLQDPILKLSEKTQRDMLRRIMKHVWTAAASKESHPNCRRELYDAHAALKSKVLALQEHAGVLPSVSSTKSEQKEAEA